MGLLDNLADIVKQATSDTASEGEVLAATNTGARAVPEGQFADGLAQASTRTQRRRSKDPLGAFQTAEAGPEGWHPQSHPQCTSTRRHHQGAGRQLPGWFRRAAGGRRPHAPASANAVEVPPQACGQEEPVARGYGRQLLLHPSTRGSSEPSAPAHSRCSCPKSRRGGGSPWASSGGSS